MSRIILSDAEASRPSSSWPRPRRIRGAHDGWRARHLGPPGDPDDVQLYVLESAWREARDHSLTDLHREVGGILVGGYYIDDHGDRPLRFVEVEGFVPCLEGQSGAGNFKFTHDSWSALRKLKEERFGDDLLMLGWHHTHPGIGLFLSGLDQFIQRNFFPEPWMPALVVDPRAQEFEFFRMRDGRVEKWSFHLLTPARRNGEPPSGVRRG
jgi:proteasome lid subunit RPN8/RPN11